MPHTIVIQSDAPNSQLTRIRESKTIQFAYHLDKPLEFNEQHYARLLWFGGTVAPCCLFVDFLQRQNFNGVLEPFLASTASGAKTSWVPLASNYIPSVGYRYIRQDDGNGIRRGQKYTSVIEIASESWINGATSTSRV